MKPMRRADRQLDNDAALSLLQTGEYGVLATADNTLQPYGVPLSYVLRNNCLYFHCALEGSKLDNIQLNNKVCFTVVGKTKILPEQFSTAYESVIVLGKAHMATDDEKTAALVELVKKYSPDYIQSGMEYITRAAAKTAVIKITIEHMTGKRRLP